MTDVARLQVNALCYKTATKPDAVIYIFGLCIVKFIYWWCWSQVDNDHNALYHYHFSVAAQRVWRL